MNTIVDILLETYDGFHATAKVKGVNPDVRLMPSRRFEYGQDVLLLTDGGPLYTGTIVPRGKLWKVAAVAKNLGRRVLGSLDFYAETPEEMAQGLLDALKPWWEDKLRWQSATADVMAEAKDYVPFDDLPREVKADIAAYLHESVPQLAGEWSYHDVLAELDDLIDTVLLERRIVPVNSLTSNKATSAQAVQKYRQMPGHTAPPILVDGSQVLEGGHRFKAAQRRGDALIAVIDIGPLIRMDWDAWLGGQTSHESFPVRSRLLGESAEKDFAMQVPITFRLGYIYYFDGNENDERYLKIGEYPSLALAYDAAIQGNYAHMYTTVIEVIEAGRVVRDMTVTQDGELVDSQTKRRVDLPEALDEIKDFALDVPFDYVAYYRVGGGPQKIIGTYASLERAKVAAQRAYEGPASSDLWVAIDELKPDRTDGTYRRLGTYHVLPDGQLIQLSRPGDVVEADEIKDFALDVPKLSWTYEIEEDYDYEPARHNQHAPKGYHAIFRWNDQPGTGGATNTYTDIEKVKRVAERQRKQFNMWNITYPFDPAIDHQLWRWVKWVRSEIQSKKVVEDLCAEIDAAAGDACKPCSLEQAEAGNYQKGHCCLHSLQIAIENAKGSTRSGTCDDGSTWSVIMPAHYGYIKGTQGKDSDHIDVYIGPKPDGFLVYVVNQNTKGGKFDEHKCMFGFGTKDEAIACYDKAFSDGLGPKLRASVVSTTVDKFKAWLKGGNHKKPFVNLAEGIVAEMLDNDLKNFARDVPIRQTFGDLQPNDVIQVGEGGSVYEILDKFYDQTGRYRRSFIGMDHRHVHAMNPGTAVEYIEYCPSVAYGEFDRRTAAAAEEPFNSEVKYLGTTAEWSPDRIWAYVKKAGEENRLSNAQAYRREHPDEPNNPYGPHDRPPLNRGVQ